MSTEVKTAGWLLQGNASATNVRAVGDGVRVPLNPWYTYHNCDGWSLAKGMHDNYDLSPVWPPVPNWANWDGVSNVADFLNLTDDLPLWYTTSGDSGVGGYARRVANELGPNFEFFECIVADWMLPYVSGRALTGAGPRRLTSPIWPGYDLVTLGDWWPLESTSFIGQLCDGVIIDITSFPTTLGYWLFGDRKSYRNAGSITFLDEMQNHEWPQPYSFNRHILLPKSMVRASYIGLRSFPGVTGTLTVFTINDSNIPPPTYQPP